MYRLHLPHLLRNFGAALAREEKEASKNSSIRITCIWEEDVINHFLMQIWISLYVTHVANKVLKLLKEDLEKLRCNMNGIR